MCACLSILSSILSYPILSKANHRIYRYAYNLNRNTTTNAINITDIIDVTNKYLIIYLLIAIQFNSILVILYIYKFIPNHQSRAAKQTTRVIVEYIG